MFIHGFDVYEIDLSIDLMKNVTMPDLCSSLLLNVQVNNGSLKKLYFPHASVLVIQPHAAFLCIVKTSLNIFFYIKEGSKS